MNRTITFKYTVGKAICFCLLILVYLSGCGHGNPEPNTGIIMGDTAPSNKISQKVLDSVLSSGDDSAKFQHISPLPSHENLWADTFDCIVTADTSINAIVLRLPKTFTDKFGDARDSVDMHTDAIYLTNDSKSETFELHQENGGGYNEFDHFAVAKTIKKHPHSIAANCNKFVTSKGAFLGMPLDIFIKVYDITCFKVTHQGNKTILSYHDKRQTYIAKYVFENGLLVSFDFGYDWS